MAIVNLSSVQNARRTNLTIGLHQSYICGDHRPIMRGYLHGSVLFFIILWIAMDPTSLQSMHRAIVPTLAAIIWTLSCSSLLHLIPWTDIRIQTVVLRCDKCGIVAICFASFVAPQLTDAMHCRPSVWFTLIVSALPNLISAVLIALGDTSPRVFLGCLISSLLTGLFMTRIDRKLVLYLGITFALYGGSMVLYLLKPGGDKKWWGYHEWMHVLVILSFYFNFQGISYLAEVCSSWRSFSRQRYIIECWAFGWCGMIIFQYGAKVTVQK